MLGAIVGYVHYLINDNCKPDAIIYKREAGAVKVSVQPSRPPNPPAIALTLGEPICAY